MVDFLIITPLQEELDALLALVEQAEKKQVPGVPTHYEASIKANDSDVQYRVAIAMPNRMGNQDAAIRTLQAITDLNPSYVIVMGIAGGYEGKVKLGDVIVATDVCYYEFGSVLFWQIVRRPEAIPVDPMLLDRARSNHQDNRWRALLGDKCSPHEPSVHFGKIAVGDKVIRNRHFIKALAKNFHGLLGVEMESYGVAKSASYASNRPRFLAIRGISDYADHKKGDGARACACASAAAFTIGFIRSLSSRPDTKPVKPRAMLPIVHASLGEISKQGVLDSLGIEDETAPLVNLEQSDLFANGCLLNPRAAVARQSDLAQRIKETSTGIHELAYCGVAHIPLLFHAGYQLSNVELTFYERNRYQKNEWKRVDGDEPGPDLVPLGLPTQSSDATGDVAFIISISDPIETPDVASVVTSPIATVQLRLISHQRDVLTSREQLNRYGHRFRQMLDDINALLPCASAIHIFYAGPPSLAVYLGQLIKPSIERRVIIYNYSQQDNPRYGWAVVLTGSTGPDDFVIDFRKESHGHV